MSMSAQDKDKITRYSVISAAVLAVVVYGYLQLRTPDVSPAPAVAAPAVVKSQGSIAASLNPPGSPGAVPRPALSSTVLTGANAAKVSTTASQYDPTLKMQPMLVAESLVYSGTGRNIFSENSAPVLAALPKPIAPVRTQVAEAPVYSGPPIPPPPPPIDLKFFGTATLADGTRQAFLLHGDDVFLAGSGSIVQRRYKVGSIATNSVEVEDLTNNNKQSLPLQKN